MPANKAAQAEVPAPARSEMISSFGEDDSVSMGDVILSVTSLTLHTNSVQRAQRGRTLMERYLGSFLHEPVVETKTAAEIRDSAKRDDEDEESLSTLPPHEMRAIAQQAMERHCRRVLDEPVPMLGDISPREAATTERGRERLVAWLKYLENLSAEQEADALMAGYDMGWMWSELGISHLRQ